jgi:hypothetical protein
MIVSKSLLARQLASSIDCTRFWKMFFQIDRFYKQKIGIVAVRINCFDKTWRDRS